MAPPQAASIACAGRTGKDLLTIQFAENFNEIPPAERGTPG
jgi:hypothetical protein